MEQYILLLRGINVSGKNIISMNELKCELELLGYVNVITYLNSGNVIFNSSKTKQEIIVEVFDMIKNKFNLEIPIYVITSNNLKSILDKSPKWWGTSNKEIYDNIIFMLPNTNYKEVCDVVGSPSENIEKIEEYNNVIFWSYDLKNYRKSNWWVKTASTSIKDKITIRTANTVRKLIDICFK